MGLLDFLFGKDDSVADSTVTGAILGALLGDKLDERNTHQEILKQLKISVAENRYYNAMAKLDRDLESLDFALNYEPEYAYGWIGSKSMLDYHIKWMRTDVLDYHKRYMELARRGDTLDEEIIWAMPRSRGGDVAGDEKTIKYALDRFEKLLQSIEDANKANEIPWGIPGIDPQVCDGPLSKNMVTMDEAIEITGMDKIGICFAMEAGALSGYGSIEVHANILFDKSQVVRYANNIMLIEPLKEMPLHRKDPPYESKRMDKIHRMIKERQEKEREEIEENEENEENER